MIYQQKIENKLTSAFLPLHLTVINESSQHNVPAGSESHFKVILVSESFSGQRLLARHRAIYQALAEELATGVHALALHTYTPEEWQRLQDTVPDSPACRGGSQLG